MIDQMPEAYRLTTPKARKPHKCGECLSEIKVGEVYHVHSGIFDGMPFRQKECRQCCAIREQYDARQPDRWEASAFESLLDDILECEYLDLAEQYLENQRNRGNESAQRTEERIQRLRERMQP